MNPPGTAPLQPSVGSAKQSGLLFQQFIPSSNPSFVAMPTAAVDQVAAVPAYPTSLVTQDVTSSNKLWLQSVPPVERAFSLIGDIRTPNPLGFIRATDTAALAHPPSRRALPTGAQIKDEQSGLLLDLFNARNRLIPQQSALFAKAKALESITDEKSATDEYLEYHAAVQSFLLNVKIFEKCFDFSTSMNARLRDSHVPAEEQRLLVYRAKEYRELLRPKHAEHGTRSVLKGDRPVARRCRTRSAASIPVSELERLTRKSNNTEERCKQCGYSNSARYEFHRHVQNCGKKRKCRYCNTLLAAYRPDSMMRHLRSSCATYQGLYKRLGYRPDPWTVPLASGA